MKSDVISKKKLSRMSFWPYFRQKCHFFSCGRGARSLLSGLRLTSPNITCILQRAEIRKMTMLSTFWRFIQKFLRTIKNGVWALWNVSYRLRLKLLLFFKFQGVPYTRQIQQKNTLQCICRSITFRRTWRILCFLKHFLAISRFRYYF